MPKKPNDYVLLNDMAAAISDYPCKLPFVKIRCLLYKSRKTELWWAGLKLVHLYQYMSLAASLRCPQRWSARAGAPLSCAPRPRLTCRVFHGHALWSSNVSHFPSSDSPLRHNWASFEEWTCWDRFLFRVSWLMFAMWTKVLLCEEGDFGLMAAWPEFQESIPD